MDRLGAAQEIDARYHTAKLVAAAFNEPDRLWREHDEIRAAMLVGHRPRESATMADVMQIHRRMVDAGLVPPRSEEMH